jgi:hypothetical protein
MDFAIDLVAAGGGHFHTQVQAQVLAGQPADLAGEAAGDRCHAEGQLQVTPHDQVTDRLVDVDMGFVQARGRCRTERCRCAQCSFDLGLADWPSFRWRPG